MATFDSINAVIGAMFVLGDVLQGAGFLVAGTATLMLGRLPRWLAVLVLTAGVTSSVLAWSQIIGLPFLVPLLLVHVAIVLPAIGIGLAMVFWLRQGTPAVATGPAPC